MATSTLSFKAVLFMVLSFSRESESELVFNKTKCEFIKLVFLSVVRRTNAFVFVFSNNTYAATAVENYNT